MKLFIGTIFALFVASQGAAIEPKTVAVTPFLENTSDLFISAWEYQNKLTDLQQDINLQLTAIRTSVSNVLKTSSRQTLEQIENNTIAILDLDAPVRAIVIPLESTACNNNLKTLLNETTEYAGFPSSNCVARYDVSVKTALKAAYALMDKYEGLFSEVQQIVVKSFIKQNAFLTPQAIIDEFQKQYNIHAEDWERIRPDIESFVKSLGGNVAVFNTVLGSCFTTVQTKLIPTYARIVDEVAECKEFDTLRNPFSMLSAPVDHQFLKLEDILPKFE
ncbi:unnamed protein product [Diamesa hyperborea]